MSQTNYFTFLIFQQERKLVKKNQIKSLLVTRTRNIVSTLFVHLQIKTNVCLKLPLITTTLTSLKARFLMQILSRKQNKSI